MCALMNSTRPGVGAGAPNRHGFTLMELLVVMALAASLAAVATPSYLDHVQQARRAEALAALTQTSLALEQWRSTHATFTANLGQDHGLGLVPEGHQGHLLTQGGHHRITVSVHEASARSRYVVTATPEPPHVDRLCPQLSLLVDQGVSVRSATPAAHTRRCWGR
jgi:type IV pilus assembly protein PilE